MKKKPHERAQEVLSEDPYLKKLLEKVEDFGGEKDQVLSALGARIMRQDDYSRGMDELRTKEQALDGYKSSLDSWYGENQAAIAEAHKIKQEKSAAATTTPAAAGSDALKALEGYVKREDVDKLVAERLSKSEEMGLALMTTMGELVGRHIHTYGEALDPNAVLALARSKGMSLAAAYSEFTADKAAALAEKRAAAEREKLKAELRAEIDKERGHGAYPVGNDDPSPVLTGLSTAKPKQGEPANYGVQAALDAYYAMNKPS